MTISHRSTLSLGDPWTSPALPILEALRRALPLDQVAMGCLHSQMPQLDELLLSHGWSVHDLSQWFGPPAGDDRLLRAAMRSGLAVHEPGKSELASPLVASGAHALALALPESLTGKRYWWLLVTRKQHAFTQNEQQLLGLYLRHWMMRFAQPGEPGLRQLLLGHDQRLLLADLQTQMQLLQEPQMVAQWLQGLPQILEQRYPNLHDDTSYDLVLSLGGQPGWVVLRRSRVVDESKALHWHLELRPLEPDDLPAVGLMKDDRVARALAYIHERFAESPSLSDIARIVHISPFHFHRLFTRQVGISPKIYLQKKQLQVAKWLLRKGGLPIGQIAQKTGFSSHGHFTSTFHRIVGHSPSEYRDQG